MSPAPKPLVETAFDRSAIHVLTLTGACSAAILEAVCSGLAEADARLAGLKLDVVGDMAEATLRLTGVSCEAARGFSDRLAGRPGVLSARVEHHLLRSGPIA
jgi:hypothetical protein